MAREYYDNKFYPDAVVVGVLAYAIMAELRAVAEYNAEHKDKMRVPRDIKPYLIDQSRTEDSGVRYFLIAGFKCDDFEDYIQYAHDTVGVGSETRWMSLVDDTTRILRKHKYIGKGLFRWYLKHIGFRFLRRERNVEWAISDIADLYYDFKIKEKPKNLISEKPRGEDMLPKPAALPQGRDC